MELDLIIIPLLLICKLKVGVEEDLAEMGAVLMVDLVHKYLGRVICIQQISYIHVQLEVEEDMVVMAVMEGLILAVEVEEGEDMVDVEEMEHHMLVEEVEDMEMEVLLV